MRALCEVEAEAEGAVWGINAAKLFTVVRIRFTAAVMRADNTWVPNVCRLQQRRHILVEVRNNVLDFLQRGCVGVRFVLAVETLQQT